MAVKMGNKVKIGITISPYLNEQAEHLLDTGKFSSMSDLVSIALAEFIGNYKREREADAQSSGSDGESITVEHIIE